jgi:hypothetical protein
MSATDALEAANNRERYLYQQIHRGNPMIKFTATTGDNRKLLGVGLSHVNLKRLKEGKPIRFKGESVGMPETDIMIFSGKTEESMAKELDPIITAETIIKGDFSG